MSRIQDNHWFYSTLRYYVDSTFHLAFRRVEYKGRHRIPTDGAVIFGPNHTNALIDALAVLMIDHRPTVFVARADIFKKPSIAKILRFLKIMPIMRIRDGYKNLKKNDAIIHEAVEVLESKVPFCIMPEGTHRPMHSLLPLVKGIFRIAMQANEAIESRMPVYIVPTGIEYGNYFRYRSTLLMEIGEPINVTEFINNHQELDVPEQMNALRDLLWERIKEQIWYLPDDDYYAGSYDLCLMGMNRLLKQQGLKHSRLDQELSARQEMSRQIAHYREQHAEAAMALLEKATTFHEERNRAKIENETITTGRDSMLHLIWESVLCIILAPYFAYAGLVSSPILLVSKWLCNKMDDRAFDNSIRYVMVLVLSPIMWLIFALIFLNTLPWMIALIAFLGVFPAHIFVHYYWKKCRLLCSAVRWHKSSSLRQTWSELYASLTLLETKK